MFNYFEVQIKVNEFTTLCNAVFHCLDREEKESWSRIGIVSPVVDMKPEIVFMPLIQAKDFSDKALIDGYKAGALVAVRYHCPWQFLYGHESIEAIRAFYKQFQEYAFDIP